MAFPRIEALTFWLLMAAGTLLMTTLAFGGFPTGWTGYAPLSEQANMGIDAYIAFFALVGLSMMLLGLNMLVTVITMRAPGMTWGRLPIFVWGTVSTAVLMLLAAPVLISTLLMLALDRTAQTELLQRPGAAAARTCTRTCSGSSGTPRSTSSRCPAWGSCSRSSRSSRASRCGATASPSRACSASSLLSFLVWQHHLFVSGINADLRPFYMFSTELISLPTGFIFICALGTLWKGRIRLTVPMLFALAWIFNFLIGGLSGVFLSDVPSDVTTHGSFFSMAHFHYTIMGGLLFAFFAGIYYWVPKMTGFQFNERLGKVHFWIMFISFNSTFGPLLVIGFLGMPRRVVTYAGYLQGANDWVSVSAFVLGASMLLFLANLVWSQRLRARARPARTHGARSRSSSSCRRRCRCTTSTGSRRSAPTRIPTVTRPRRCRSASRDRASEADGMTELAHPSTDYCVLEREPPAVLAANLQRRARGCWRARRSFFFFAFLFAYFYLRSLNNDRLWKPKGVDPSTAIGTPRSPSASSSAAVLVWLGLADHRAERRPRGASRARSRWSC